MKRLVLSIGLILATAGCAVAQTPSTVPAAPAVPTVEMKGKPLSADTPVEQTLDALDQVGRGLKDFDAQVSMGQNDDVTGVDTRRTGKVSYQVKKEGDARVHVVFDKKIVGKRMQEKKIEYLLDDGWLTDRNYESRTEIRRQISKPGTKINMLKLGEGPFPLPIGQKREEVQAIFDVKKVPAAKEDPADTVHLQLTPKPGTSFERKFKAIDVWVESKTHFPVRIDTLDKNQATHRVTDLTDIRVNPGLKDSDFELQKISGDWQSSQELYAE